MRNTAANKKCNHCGGVAVIYRDRAFGWVCIAHAREDASKDAVRNKVYMPNPDHHITEYFMKKLHLVYN